MTPPPRPETRTPGDVTFGELGDFLTAEELSRCPSWLTFAAATLERHQPTAPHATPKIPTDRADSR